MSYELIENFPDMLPREADSKFRKYLDAHQDELDKFEENIEQALMTHRVNEATGRDLDRIGRLYGDVGSRRGRSDENYRSYLRGVVKAFSGRGTRPGMKDGISAAFDLNREDVEIEEYFDDNEYDVIISNWGYHNSRNLAEIAQIVDPSGVKLRTIKYDSGIVDTMAADDSVSAYEIDIIITDSMSSDDTIEFYETPYLTWNQETWDTSVWAPPTSEVAGREAGEYGGSQFGQITY